MTDDRRERYAAAILDALAQDTSRGPNWGEAADAAMAVADEELASQKHSMGEEWAKAYAEAASLSTELAEVRGLYYDVVQDRNAYYTQARNFRADNARLAEENARLRAELSQVSADALSTETQAAELSATIERVRAESDKLPGAQWLHGPSIREALNGESA
ncbi:hypothetical protein OG709_29965 [Streptomyces sp. NBC_01267]|uniref:hypothetical protein n=1 Tax=Streptomyces sp. NBC_01267 TaxID=2903805 RepID=UPI002E337795|nr:hypothetical protein [Streptomyces sp. NBC_01267]